METYIRSKPDIERLIQAARRQIPCDLVIRNARIINVFSHDITNGEIAVIDGVIAAIGTGYEGARIVDLEGRWCAPGLIDGHLHVESSMVPIPEFARAVVPHGTTTIILDPHEIANVMGMTGVGYMLKSSKYNPISVYMMLPSCVPATAMETAGAELKAIDLLSMIQDRWVLGMGEMMNFPGVLNCHDEVLDKIRIAESKLIDGHAPGLSGADLNAYIAAGMRSDHECTTVTEAMEKLRLGMHIMIREGSTTKNLKDLLPIVTPHTISQCFFVTDDRNPAELMDIGHIDQMVRTAIAEGLDPVSAIQLATINTARYFGLKQIGAVAPGYAADLIVIDDLPKFVISKVFKNGICVAEDGTATYANVERSHLNLRGSVNVKWIELDHFCRRIESDAFRVIEAIPGQIVTRECIETNPVSENGCIVSDPSRDLLKMAVIERHYGSGRTGIGMVRGFGLKKGAIASTIAHDSHNIIAIGVRDEDIFAAVVQLVKQQGGLAAAVDGEVVEALPLPIGGLMSDKPLPEVRQRLDALVRTSHRLGCTLEHPFMTLAFMSLPVIPDIKLTDRGLFDVRTFSFVDLFVFR